MKNTTNVFLKGMTSDMHPLTTSQLEYTDALNATLITFNGNEQMMQNDMGNTLIQDSKTGNIMGLREGFIPVGMKEHGGIMYIASVNKDGVGEIGTIPSPVIRYNKKDEFNLNQLLLTIDPDKGYGDLVKLTDYSLKAGDKFVVFLPLDDTSSGDVSFNCPDSSHLITTPIIENNTNLGIYRIGLYSQADSQVYDLNDLVDGLKFSFKLKSGNTNLNRWFIDLDNEELDIDSSFVNENSSDPNKKLSFIMYPRISSGYPSVRLEINKLDSFSLLPNHTSTDETDDSRRYPFTIFDNSAKKYITYIRGFEYITTSGIHPTKLKINLVADSIEEPLIENKELEFESEIDPIYRTRVNDTSKFRIAFKPDEDYQDLNNDYYNSHTTGISVSIGQNSNIWFTLTVDYYYTNIKLGTYTCRYNPYVYDTLKNFRLIKYVANENYNGEGNIWFLQYYDVKLRYATYLEKTASGSYSDSGESRQYPNPSGCGISLDQCHSDPNNNSAYIYNGSAFIYESIPSGTYRKHSIKKIDSILMSNRYGISLNNLIPSNNRSDFLETINGWDNLTADYLYITTVNQIVNSNIILNYNLNHLGLRIIRDAPIQDPSTYYKDMKILLHLLRDPELNLLGKTNSETKYYLLLYIDNWNDVCIFAPNDRYSGLLKIDTEYFKELLTVKTGGNSNLYYNPLINFITNVPDSCNETFYLKGDPWIDRHGYCNDSTIDLSVDIITKLNITGISDYQVVPQINVVYEEDGQIYPGYLNGNSVVEEIDVDITRNYLLKNGISEGAYILGAPYHSFEDTSIYGSGFGYYTFKSNSEYDNLDIKLNNGTYVVNFNIYSYDSNLGGIDIYLKDARNSFITITPNNSCVKFTVPDSGYIIDRIKVNGPTNRSYKVTSYGLYKTTDLYDPASDSIKLQTVYTYSEDGKSCLGKPYYYSGGSAFCGYQKSKETYTSDNNPYNDIEIRRCLAPQ